jgi:hypothetical protein
MPPNGRNPVTIAGRKNAAFLRVVNGTPMEVELHSPFQAYVDQTLRAIAAEYKLTLQVGEALERRPQAFLVREKENLPPHLQPPPFLPFVATVISYKATV